MAQHAYDLVLRGGTVFDGSGAPGVFADVAIKDGPRRSTRGARSSRRASSTSTPTMTARRPGTSGCSPSSWHGVTTVVMGNCGVGFAPCRPEDHDRLIRLMEGVEDIPFPVLTEGLPWNWESYPEYLDGLARRRFDVDVGSSCRTRRCGSS
jgi:N-acyl-D-aspartate/D-glutamate deacylase